MSLEQVAQLRLEYDANQAVCTRVAGLGTDHQNSFTVDLVASVVDLALNQPPDVLQVRKKLDGLLSLHFLARPSGAVGFFEVKHLALAKTRAAQHVVRVGFQRDAEISRLQDFAHVTIAAGVRREDPGLEIDVSQVLVEHFKNRFMTETTIAVDDAEAFR